MAARQHTTSAHSVLITDQPPCADGDAASAIARLGGTLLGVGVTRELRTELSFVLTAMGIFPSYSSSEVLALELLSRGNLFDTVLIEIPPSTEANAPFLAQLRARHPTVPVFVVSRCPTDQYVLYRGSDPGRRIDDVDVSFLAREILAAVAQDDLEPVCASGVLPIGSVSPAESIFPECPVIIR